MLINLDTMEFCILSILRCWIRVNKMSTPELVFFTVGHGLYNFKVSQDSFD